MVPVTGLDLHFLPLGENYCSPPSSRRRQGSPGALHLNGFESGSNPKKQIRPTQRSVLFVWCRWPDSNRYAVASSNSIVYFCGKSKHIFRNYTLCFTWRLCILENYVIISKNMLFRSSLWKTAFTTQSVSPRSGWRTNSNLPTKKRGFRLSFFIFYSPASTHS